MILWPKHHLSQVCGWDSFGSNTQPVNWQSHTHTQFSCMVYSVLNAYTGTLASNCHNYALCNLEVSPMNGLATYPLQAAACRQVRPQSSGTLRSISGITDSSLRTQSMCPYRAATCTGIIPYTPRLQIDIPCYSSYYCEIENFVKTTNAELKQIIKESVHIKTSGWGDRYLTVLTLFDSIQEPFMLL